MLRCKICNGGDANQLGFCHDCYVNHRRDTWYKKSYGISWDGVLDKIEQQQGLCAICATTLTLDMPKTWHLDHCHHTKKPRSILCARCNLGLGQFYDNELLLENAAEYVREWQERHLYEQGGEHAREAGRAPTDAS